MSGRSGLIAGVAGILLAGSGCVSCGNHSYGEAHEVGPDCEVPTCQRNQVYVFAVSGMNPLDMLALDALRGELARRGFAKVATGQAVHAGWMTREMRRIREEQPEAVFVLLGSEGGAVTAAKLAEQAVADGLPVGAVVLVSRDPKPAPAVGNNLRVEAVNGHGSEHAAGVATVLNEVAATTPLPVIVERVGWDYPHAPEPRPEIEPRDPNWSFLFDRGTPERVVPTGGGLVPAVAASRPAPPAVVPAGGRLP